MDFYMGFSILLIFWTAIHVIDLLLKLNKSTQERYNLWNINSGITLGLFNIKWFTKSLNRFFHSASNLSWFPWIAWFNFGVLLSLLSSIFGVALLALLVFNTVSQRVVEHEILSPVMPGVNVPFSHVGFLILSIIIAGFVHEIGHAIAAVKEGVRVDGFGLIFFILYPGAFTNINTVDLEGLDPKRKLRIFSAGNWHNFVMMLFGILLLNVLPILMMPCYMANVGVSVTFIGQNSVLTGRLGLNRGDVITRLNNCPIKNRDDWMNCLQSIRDGNGASNDSSRQGYCIPMTRLRQLDVSSGLKMKTIWGNIDCCPQNRSRTHLCFRYTIYNSQFPRYTCLPVRAVTSKPPSCATQSDCSHSNSPPIASSNQCVWPSLENSTRLVRIQHARTKPSSPSSAAVLFLGNINDLLLDSSLVLSNYVPRWFMIPLSLPEAIETFLSYLIAISAALILFNSVPCHSLDGQWITQATIDALLTRTALRNSRRKISSIITYCGSILLLTNITMSLYFMLHGQH